MSAFLLAAVKLKRSLSERTGLALTADEVAALWPAIRAAIEHPPIGAEHEMTTTDGMTSMPTEVGPQETVNARRPAPTEEELRTLLGDV